MEAFEVRRISLGDGDSLPRDEKVVLYVEVNEPAPVVDGWPHVGITYKVIDRKTNQPVFASNTVLVNQFIQTGNPIIPVASVVQLSQIPPGAYRLEVQARDSIQNVSPVRSAEFDLN